MTRLVVKNGDEKDKCNEIGLGECSKYRDHHGLKNQRNWKNLCDYLETKRNFTLISYILCISTPIQKLKMKMFEMKISCDS